MCAPLQHTSNKTKQTITPHPPLTFHHTFSEHSHIGIHASVIIITFLKCLLRKDQASKHHIPVHSSNVHPSAHPRGAANEVLLDLNRARQGIRNPFMNFRLASHFQSNMSHVVCFGYQWESVLVCHKHCMRTPLVHTQKALHLLSHTHPIGSVKPETWSVHKR